MIGHHTHFRENGDLPRWLGSAAKKKPPFCNAVGVVIRRIERWDRVKIKPTESESQAEH